MKYVLLVAPVDGNGGIQSWTKKYLKTFQSSSYGIIHEPVSQRRSDKPSNSRIGRCIDGLLDLFDVYKRVKKRINSNEHTIMIMHTTTSGSLGTLRDYALAKLCIKHRIKTILHCRYGCIPEDYKGKGFWGSLLRKTMRIYDQIWVLDSRSEQALRSDPYLTNKVHLTPNSISVPATCDLSPKSYTKVGFVGNLIPSKGLYELVQAVMKCPENTQLTIIGPGQREVYEQIINFSKERFGKQIQIKGKLPNDKAVAAIKGLDIIALPTYYRSEAFPISILEAMSYGKMVISTPRAAIKDMLTSTDGCLCGILVKEKSVDDIKNAICWCQENSKMADVMCAKAYAKASSCYRTEVIYSLYHQLYDKLIEKSRDEGR